MASVTDILNLALVKLGEEETITSPTENSKRARLANFIYPMMRDAVLRDGLWNFAQKRAVLAQDSETPAFDYLYQYQLPADCIKVYTINKFQDDFIVEGKKLLTNANAVNLIYIFKETETGNFDPLFVDALSTRIALELALPIQNNTAQLARLQASYKESLRSAKYSDAVEGSVKLMRTTQFTDARK